MLPSPAEGRPTGGPVGSMPAGMSGRARYRSTEPEASGGDQGGAAAGETVEDCATGRHDQGAEVAHQGEALDGRVRVGPASSRSRRDGLAA